MEFELVLGVLRSGRHEVSQRGVRMPCPPTRTLSAMIPRGSIWDGSLIIALKFEAVQGGYTRTGRVTGLGRRHVYNLRV